VEAQHRHRPVEGAQTAGAVEDRGLEVAQRPGPRADMLVLRDEAAVVVLEGVTELFACTTATSTTRPKGARAASLGPGSRRARPPRSPSLRRAQRGRGSSRARGTAGQTAPASAKTTAKPTAERTSGQLKAKKVSGLKGTAAGSAAPRGRRAPRRPRAEQPEGGTDEPHGGGLAQDQLGETSPRVAPRRASGRAPAGARAPARRRCGRC